MVIKDEKETSKMKFIRVATKLFITIGIMISTLSHAFTSRDEQLSEMKNELKEKIRRLESGQIYESDSQFFSHI